MPRVKELKKGDFFVLKDIEFSRENQVWIRGEYDRASKTYSAINYTDMNRERFFKGDKIIFNNITF